MQRLPERVAGEGILLRRWQVDDAADQERAVAESADHLRPWMSWMANEPQALSARRAMIARWEKDWSAGCDVYLAVVVGEELAGSAGLHRRERPDVLEIGYWTHISFLRQGVATQVAWLLTDTALALPEITRVEIHHDKANLASSAIPRRLGYELVGEHPDGPQAPAETGIDCVWRIERGQWTGR